MSNYPKLTHYVSEIDQFLQSFDRENPEKSLSQLGEENKYRRIYYLRDVADRPTKTNKLWEDF